MNTLLATLEALDQETGGSQKPASMGVPMPLPQGRNQYQITAAPQAEFVENLGYKIVVPVANADASGIVDVIVPKPGDTNKWADLSKEMFAAFAIAIGVPTDPQGGVRMSTVATALPGAAGKWVTLDVKHKSMPGKVVNGEKRPDWIKQQVKWAPAETSGPSAAAVVLQAADSFGASPVQQDDGIPF